MFSVCAGVFALSHRPRGQHCTHVHATPALTCDPLLRPSPAQLGFVIIKYKKQNAINTQERGAYFQELLPAMKLVKYYAWEQFFLKEVSEVRGALQTPGGLGAQGAAVKPPCVRPLLPCSPAVHGPLLCLACDLASLSNHLPPHLARRSASASWPSSARST